MYECECGKEYKSKRGLAMHKNTCEYTVKDTDEVQATKPNNDNIVRRIAKLRDAAKSCGDAETRYKLEQEARELEG